MAYAKIHIENLGPIREGTFELRPLTIFIGPNNTGKTYAATAAYALINGLRMDSEFPSVEIGGPGNETVGIQHLVAGQLLRSFSNAFAEADIGSLRRFDADDASPLRVDVVGRDASDAVVRIEVRRAAEPFAEIAERIAPTVRYDGPPEDADSGLRIARIELMSAWLDTVRELGLPPGGATYLPAGRDGLIASLPLLATLSFRLLRQDMGNARRDAQPLKSVVTDYLERLLNSGQGLDRALWKALAPALSLLEDDVLEGTIERDRSAGGLPRFFYRFGSERLPLEKASSMVADMASLALWIREYLMPAELLIFDEPEAHLHPANERLVAQVLVRLAHTGVRVLVPTHSSTIVHQVTNIVRSSLLSGPERERLGYTEDDRLHSDEVGVYRFRPTDEGVIIDEVPYEADFGFSEEEFYDVADDISRETYQIESRLPAHA